MLKMFNYSNKLSKWIVKIIFCALKEIYLYLSYDVFNIYNNDKLAHKVLLNLDYSIIKNAYKLHQYTNSTSDPEDKLYLFDHLKYIREYFGKTIEEVSQNTGINKNQLYSYESGRIEPRQNNLEKIASYYDLTVKTFVNLEIFAYVKKQKLLNIENPKYNISNLQEKWNLVNQNIHTNITQINRQNRAIRTLNKLYYSSQEYGSGIFIASNNSAYITTLTECECFDFQNRRKPCKHMYALASNFKLIKLSECNNYNYPINFFKAIKSFRDLIKSNYDCACTLLYLKNYKAAQLPLIIEKDKIRNLFLENIFITNNTLRDVSPMLSSMKKVELLELINDTNLKSLKKVELIEQITLNYPNVINQLKDKYIEVDLKDDYDFLYRSFYKSLNI